jgi:glycosidase
MRARRLAAILLAACLAQAAGAQPQPQPPGATGPADGSAPACKPDPLPGVTLFLRGGMNSWAPVDEYAFEYRCDAHYLNVDLRARQEFKIADADWSPATNFGAAPDGELALGGGNAARHFDGEHTLRLSIDGPRARLEIGPRRFAAAGPRAVDDPVARGLRFDSRSSVHKSPFGAVPRGAQIRYRVAAPRGVQALTLVIENRRLEGNQDKLHYTELARVSLRAQAARSGSLRWTATHRFTAPGVYGYWFEAHIGGERYVLQNNNDQLHWTRERGTGGAATVAFLPPAARSIRRFRQTVYDSAYRVPAWARDAIYYQIFPDRFRNGDPGNDPVPGRDRYRQGSVEKHANWLDKPWRPGSGDGSDELYNNDFFGGDLAGIVDKLDELRDLGVDTLYLTPIFKAPSNHKYDTADYKQIDPAFGSEADFVRLTREAARRGMRILPDTSFNHVGSDSPYFDRYGNWPELGAFEGGKPNPASPYASWFKFDAAQADPDKQYRHWGGPDLPEVDKSSVEFRKHVFAAPDSVSRKWLDLGAAGWRMDVAPWVPDDFWRAWRRAVKQHRPDALTLAETWFDASKYLVGDMFDSTMNYIFRNAVLDHAGGGRAQDLVAQLEHLREAYPPQAHFALMNLISSHDVARAVHVLGWHDQAADAPQARRARERLKLAAFIQMTQPGAPMVYYGDEVGMTGGEDPYNRGAYPWPDLGGQPDLALREVFRQLIALRRQHAVLRHGRMLAMQALDEQVSLSRRVLGHTRAWVLSSNAEVPRTVSLPRAALAGARRLRDAQTGEVLHVDRQHALSVTIPARWGRVLLVAND